MQNVTIYYHPPKGNNKVWLTSLTLNEGEAILERDGVLHVAKLEHIKELQAEEYAKLYPKLAKLH